jgi:hypothetical protein
MAYAVHTATCTYLLDDDGVCRWIVSQQGMVPNHVRQCIGAQFVACVDVTVEGALVAELRVGARALFVQHAGDRMVMLRTGPIHHVDDRRTDHPSGETPPPAAALSDQTHGHYGKPAPSARPVGVVLPAPRPPPSFGVVRYHGEEQTITFSRATERLSADTGETDLPTERR